MKVLYIFLATVFLFSQCGLPAEKDDKMLLIDRPGFSLEYPSSWKVDTKDEDYNPDKLFSIDSPGDDAMVMFMIIDGDLDPAELLQDQEETTTESYIKKPESVTSFTKWGNLDGKGKIIRGKIMGIFKGQLNFFSCSYHGKTIFVTEQFYDEDADKLMPLFNKIATSFKLKAVNN